MQSATKRLPHIVILGAGGFVGRALVPHILRSGHPVTILTRKIVDIGTETEDLDYRLVDFEDIDTLVKGIPKKSIIVNLIFAGENLEKNIRIANNIARAAKKCGARKFIHVSTAVTVGKSSCLNITEEIESAPKTFYEKVKNMVDHNFRREFSDSSVQLFVLKPTAIFGPGGKNLWKLYTGIRKDNKFIFYLKACVNKNRNAHLVRLEKVLNVIMFMIELQVSNSYNEFLISDDNVKLNKFGELDEFIRDRLTMGRRIIPVISLPEFIVRLALKIRGLSDINSRRVYCDQRLIDFGFVDYSRSFEETLNDTLCEFHVRYSNSTVEKGRE